MCFAACAAVHAGSPLVTCFELLDPANEPSARPCSQPQLSMGNALEKVSRPKEKAHSALSTEQGVPPKGAYLGAERAVPRLGGVMCSAWCAIISL